jgi:hypothetical protein
VAERDEALKLAVKNCIEQGILKEILEAHASAAHNVFLEQMDIFWRRPVLARA